MACLPGMPCFGNHPNNPSPITCGVDPCFTYKTTTDLAHYVGPNLPCIDVNTCETLTTIIQKIDYALCGENLAKTFIDTLLTNSTLYNLFCTQIVQNCITCDYMKECIDCDYITGCIPPCPPCPTTSTTSTTTTETPCYCYQVDVSSGTVYNVSWYDCESGSIQSTNVSNETFRMCAQKNSVYFSLVSGTGAFSLSGGTTLCSMNSDCYEEFIMNAEDVDFIAINRIDSTGVTSIFRPIIIDWGDGSETILDNGQTVYNNSNPLSVQAYPRHTYSSPYTGPIKIKRPDLTKIPTLQLTDVFGPLVQPVGKSLIITGPEIAKLNGLTNLFATSAKLNCTTSELPRTLTLINSILGNISGDIANIPSNMTSFSLGTMNISGTPYPNGNTISGNISTLKSTLTFVAVFGTNTLTGNINSIPTSLKNNLTGFLIGGSNTITGDLTSTFASNTVMTQFTVFGNNTLFGNLDGPGSGPAFASTLMVNFQITGQSYPSGTTLGAFGHMTGLNTLTLEFNENVLPYPTNIGTSLTGDINDLPKSITFLLIAGANTVSGDIANLPTAPTYVNIRGIATGWQPGGGNTVTGLTNDIPTTCNLFVLAGKNTLGGDVKDIPSVANLTIVLISSNFNTVSGNLWELPSQLKVFELGGGTGSITYAPTVPYPTLTPTKTWAASFNWIKVYRGSSLLSVNDMSQLLIDLDATTWSTSASYITKEFGVLGTGPSYYDPIATPAYTNLTTVQGVNVQFT